MTSRSQRPKEEETSKERSHEITYRRVEKKKEVETKEVKKENE